MKKTLFFVCMLMGLRLLHAQSIVGPARVTNDEYGFTAIITTTIAGDSVESTYQYPGSLMMIPAEGEVIKFESIESFVHGGKTFKFLFLAKRLVRGKTAWYVIIKTDLIEVESK